MRFSKNLASEKSAILTTFRKYHLTSRVLNIFELSFFGSSQEKTPLPESERKLKISLPMLAQFNFEIMTTLVEPKISIPFHTN